MTKEPPNTEQKKSDAEEGVKVSSSSSSRAHTLTLKEKENLFFIAVKGNNLPAVQQLLSEGVSANTLQEDGMTALMEAAYKGSANIVECLLANGAAEQIDMTQKDGYTALMFATLAGSLDTVQLLLNAGARTDILNNVARTAAQLGAFVGRHDCVALINNFVGDERVKYYTQKHGLESAPKLKEHIADAVHKYMMIPNLNPVRMLFEIQKNKDLLAHFTSVYDVIDTEVVNNYKSVNEILSLKLHFLACVLKKAHSWHTGTEGKGGLDALIKYLLRGRPEDGFLINIEKLLRDSLKSFPFARSNIFQQVVKVLSRTTIGDDPSALCTITQSLNGMQSADFSECCTTCCERNVTNKCSVCKSVKYCDATCQKLHWATHKKFCAHLKDTHDKMQAEEARIKAEEEKLRVACNSTNNNDDVDEQNEQVEQLQDLSISDQQNSESENTSNSGVPVDSNGGVPVDSNGSC